MSIRDRIMATLPLLALAAWGREHSTPVVWIAWFIGLGLLLAMEVRSGTLRKHDLFDHPVTGAAPLETGRAAVAIVTLIFFALLFMPTPISM